MFQFPMLQRPPRRVRASMHQPLFTLPLTGLIRSCLTIFGFALLTTALAQSQTLTVNFGSSQGAVTHGASGWLYGQAEAGIPTQNMMAPLKPQISAQKPYQGQQHAGGDATQVIGSYVSSGGQQMEIYMQDIYQTFYPSYPGISSYQATVTSEMNALASNPNHASFAYDPFNEPDGQWYGDYGGEITNLPQFESDWKTIYQTIRSIDSSAVIVGPSFYDYNATQYQEFLTYAKANNVLPNQLSWHELQSNFFTGWSSRLSSIQGIESGLGISLPIVINEYGLGSGTLGVPGNMVQWIARFEAAKVDGCIAYWSPDGDMGELVAEGVNNQATGAWWLYQWYGSMTGNTYAVTPPNSNAEGLNGLASADSANDQARVVFGGGSGTVNVVLNGLNSLSYLSGSKVHVTVWGVDSTAAYSNGDGVEPSNGPYYIQEGDYNVSGGSTTVTVSSTNTNSAYFLIVTPAKSLSTVGTAGKYEAEYADLFGTADVTYGSNTGYSGTYFVTGYGTGSNTETEFDINAASNGFYNLDLRYSSPQGSKSLYIYLNGSNIDTISLPATVNGNTWSDVTTTLYLTQGINRIAYGALASSGSDGVQLDYLKISSGSGTNTTYEATASANTVGGSAERENDSTAPGGTKVGYIGQGSANYLQVNNVNVPSSGLYRMLVTYANDEIYSGSQAGPVFRFAQISVNGGTAAQVYFNNTFSWSNWVTQEIDVNLNSGNNTIRFSNSTTSPSPTIDSGWAPDIATIQIGSAY